MTEEELVQLDKLIRFHESSIFSFRHLMSPSSIALEELTIKFLKKLQEK